MRCIALTGAYKESHYRTVYFHNSGPAADAGISAILDGDCECGGCIPQATKDVFVILVATERLDARPANRIAEKLGGVPVLTSDDYNMYELVSILRACHMMASSRYHGIVTSMPGLVPSAGITMDERIRNLMRERGHQDLLMTVDDPDLEGEAAGGAGEVELAKAKRLPTGIARTVVQEFESDGAHGCVFRRGSAETVSGI